GTHGNQAIAKKDYGRQLQVTGLGQTRVAAAAELDVICRRVGAPTAPLFLRQLGIGDRTDAEALAKGRARVATLLSVTAGDVANMASGVRKISDNEYHQICFNFYEYLSPGRGVDTCVRTGPEIENPPADDDPAVILGHELVHAWRMMAGRRVVRE